MLVARSVNCRLIIILFFIIFTLTISTHIKADTFKIKDLPQVTLSSETEIHWSPAIGKVLKKYDFCKQIVLPDPVKSNPGRRDFTLSFWIYPYDAERPQNIIYANDREGLFKVAIVNGGPWISIRSRDQHKLIIRPSDWLKSHAPIEPERWTQVIVSVQTGQSVSVFINGVRAIRKDWPQGLKTSIPDKWLLGGKGKNINFSGKVTWLQLIGSGLNVSGCRDLFYQSGKVSQTDLILKPDNFSGQRFEVFRNSQLLASLPGFVTGLQVPLKLGENKVEVQARDNSGAVLDKASVKIKRIKPKPPELAFSWIGLVGFLVTTGSLVYFSLMVTRRFFDAQGPPAIIAVFCISITVIVLLAETLGRISYSYHIYLYPLLLLGIFSYCSSHNGNRVKFRNLVNPIRNFWQNLDIYARLALLIWCLLLFYFLIYICLFPPTAHSDAMSYHLPGPVYWAAQGQLGYIPHVDFRINYFPHLMELLYGYYFLFTKSMYGVAIVNWLLAGVLVPVSLYMLSRLVTSDKSLALIVALVGSTLPQILVQIHTAYVDAALTAFMLGALGMTLWHKRSNWRNALLIGITAGVALGTKTAGLLGAGGIFLIFGIWNIWNGLAWTSTARQLVLVMGSCCLVGGAVYLVNWLYMGNPFYPIPFDFGPIHFSGGEYISKFGAVKSVVLKRESVDLFKLLVYIFFWLPAIFLGLFRFEYRLGLTFEVLTLYALLGLWCYYILYLRTLPSKKTYLQILGKTEWIYWIVGTALILFGLCTLYDFNIIFLPKWSYVFDTHGAQNYICCLLVLPFMAWFLYSARSTDGSNKTCPGGNKKIVFFVVMWTLVIYVAFVQSFLPLGQVDRYCIFLIAIPVVLLSQSAFQWQDRIRKIFKIGLILFLGYACINYGVGEDITGKGHFSRFKKIFIKNKSISSMGMYFRRFDKSLLWAKALSPKQDVIIISKRSQSQFRYLWPDFNCVVYKTHPYGPYIMDSEVDLIPASILSPIKEYLSSISGYGNLNTIKQYQKAYKYGLPYIDYLAKDLGVSNIFAKVPIPDSLVPKDWNIVFKEPWGILYSRSFQ